jgi:cytochrome c oxidase subunit III
MAVGAATTAARRPSVVGVGTVVFLASELMFFAGLFAAWFTLRAGTDVWPPEGVHLDVVRTALATALLVGSSFTMHAGDKAAHRGDLDGAIRWVLVTFALGAVFLANQVLEYTELDFTHTSHAYGSIFYLMTGFHGLHVLIGLGIMATILWVGTGRTRAPLSEPLTMASYYWHFVDVVWVGMFATIYLIR